MSCPRVRRRGEWSSVISLIVFQELFFSMCLRFWWSIINPSNGHSWGFCSIPRHLLQDASVCWWEALPLAAKKHNKGVSLCLTHAEQLLVAQWLLTLDKGASVYGAFLFLFRCFGGKVFLFSTHVITPYLFNSVVFLQSYLVMLSPSDA